MTRPFYVGICGKARSGKDTFATMLSMEIENLDSSCDTYCASLATPIKNMIDVMLEGAGLSLFCIGKEDEIPELGVSPRQLYQTLGTNWGRGFVSPDLWIKLLVSSCESLAKRPAIIIVPDIRFDNEAEWVDLMLQINRKDCEEVAAHESENGISPELVTHFISNNDSLQALHKKARATATRILSAYNEFKSDENT